MTEMAVVTEERTLSAHEKLLYDVIKRQAGTLKKAITEGTMNSIEAGTPEIIIRMWQEESETGDDGKPRAYLHIEDRGIGIKTEEEITLHFETFGQPHEENENKIYANFRMGRGQMFAFGENTWRTSQFKMEVDINKKGLTYTLTKGLEEAEGCVIDIVLYENPIGDWQCRSIEALREDVAEMVRYVNVPVFFNDKQISVNPTTLNWDFEDGDAYYLFNDASQLKIYNLGIYVHSIPKSQAGVGGIVVSKNQLKVNFARNNVQGDCEVFKRIRQVVQINKLKKVAKKYRSLSADERYSLLRDFRDGTIQYSDMVGKRIFKTAQGKWYSFNMILESPLPWTFAPDGNMKADKCIESGAALCLSQGMLDELCYYDEKDCFLDWIMAEQLRIDPTLEDYEQNISRWERNTILKKLNSKRVAYIRFSSTDMVAQEGLAILELNESFQLVVKINAVEKRILNVLNGACSDVWHGRKICFGQSTVASAWTDGCSYIALDRNWVKRLPLGNIGGALQLFVTLAHEMAHDGNTAGSHVHGPEFYERYYRITHDKTYHRNPLFHAFGFVKAMKQSRIDEQQAKQDAKDKEVMEKLGMSISEENIAASTK